MTEPKPMDPERLGLIRKALADGPTCFRLSRDAAAELLADRDHHENKAERWRARCPVTAEDVREADVTWPAFDAWAEAHGFAPARCPNRWDTPQLKIVGRSDIGWVRGDTFYGEPHAWPGNRRAYGLPGQVAAFVMFVSKTDQRPAHDILDEMAAAR